MNCDQVFDVLTRGPFPTGQKSDCAVEAHLASCCDCARLAEALRPALELFEEAVTAEESRTLPGYWGQLATAPAQVATLRFEPIARPAQQPWIVLASRRVGTQLASPTMWRFAAAVAFGVVTISALRSLGLSQPSQHSSAASNLGPSCLYYAFKQPETTTAVTDTNKSQFGQAGLRGLACCTHCHNAQADTRIPQSATLKVATTCQSCHSQPGAAQQPGESQKPRG